MKIIGSKWSEERISVLLAIKWLCIMQIVDCTIICMRVYNNNYYRRCFVDLIYLVMKVLEVELFTQI